MRSTTTDTLIGQDLISAAEGVGGFSKIDEFKNSKVEVINLIEGADYVPTETVYQNEAEWSFVENVKLHSIRLVNKGIQPLEIVVFRITKDSIKK